MEWQNLPKILSEVLSRLIFRRRLPKGQRVPYLHQKVWVIKTTAGEFVALDLRRRYDYHQNWVGTFMKLPVVPEHGEVVVYPNDIVNIFNTEAGLFFMSGTHKPDDRFITERNGVKGEAVECLLYQRGIKRIVGLI